MTEAVIDPNLHLLNAKDHLELIEGWVGPVLLRRCNTWAEGVWLGHGFTGIVGGEYASFSPENVRLDLRRTECQDRVVRVFGSNYEFAWMQEHKFEAWEAVALYAV